MPALSLIAAIALLFACPLYAQPQAGIVKSVSGQVTVQRNGTGFAAKAGDHLSLADILITRSGSYAGIIFTDGTTFTVGPDTEFRLDRYRFDPGRNEYDFSIYMKKGSGVYNSGKIGKLAPETVNLSTPRASVGIRGTRFILTVD